MVIVLSYFIFVCLHKALIKLFLFHLKNNNFQIRKELKEERNHSKIIENELLTIKLKTKATITEEVLENKKTTEKEYQLKEKLEQTKIENISLIKRIEIAEKVKIKFIIIKNNLINLREN